MDQIESPLGSSGNPVRPAQIIALALFSSVLIFTTIGLIVAEQIPAGSSKGYVALFATGFAVVMMVMANLLPNLISSMVVKPTDTLEQLAFRWRSRKMLYSALCEGAAFMNLIAWLVDRQQYSLLVVAALLAMMMSKFPTETGWRHFVENHRTPR